MVSSATDEKKQIYLSNPCLHPGMQPGKAEAPTAQEWECSLPFVGRVEVKDVRCSKIELPQVLSWGGKNDLVNYVKRQSQLFQFTNEKTKSVSESLSHTEWSTQGSKSPHRHVIHNRNECPRLTCSSQEQHSPYSLTFAPWFYVFGLSSKENSLHQRAWRSSLATQWCRLCAFTAEDAGSIPGREAMIPQATQWGQRKKKHTTEGMSLFLLKFSAGSEQFPAIASKSRASTTNTHLTLLAGPRAPPSNPEQFPGLSQRNALVPVQAFLEIWTEAFAKRFHPAAFPNLVWRKIPRSQPVCEATRGLQWRPPRATTFIQIHQDSVLGRNGRSPLRSSQVCFESLPESCQSLQCANGVENDSVATLELVNPPAPTCRCPVERSWHFSIKEYPFNHSVPLSSHFRY